MDEINQQLTEKTEAPKKKPDLTGIPVQVQENFENYSGLSFDDVRVHYNSDKPAQLQSLAYTQGSEVHIAPGQEKHLKHELGHVVQQKQGLVSPTSEINGQRINESPVLERGADLIASETAAYGDNASRTESPPKNAGANTPVFQFIRAVPTPPKSRELPPEKAIEDTGSKASDAAETVDKPADSGTPGDATSEPPSQSLAMPPSLEIPTYNYKPNPLAMPPSLEEPISTDAFSAAFAGLQKKVDKLNADFDTAKTSADGSLANAISVLKTVNINDAQSVEKDKRIIEHAAIEHNSDIATDETLPQTKERADRRIQVINYIKDDLDIHTEFVSKLKKIKKKKTTFPWKSAPSGEFIAQATKRFTDGTKKMRIAYNNALKVEQADSGLNTFSPEYVNNDAAYYSHDKKQIFMNLELDVQGSANPLLMAARHGGAATAFHELGHYIDLNSFNASWYDKDELKKNLDTDFAEYKKKRQEENSVAGKFTEGAAYYWDKVLLAKEYDDVSDIIHGLSSILVEKRKKAATPPMPLTPPSPSIPPTAPPGPAVPEEKPIVGEFGHFGAGYWENAGAVENETAAHMLESGFEELKKGAFKEVFPKSYKYLKEQFRIAVKSQFDESKKTQFQGASEWLKANKTERKDK